MFENAFKYVDDIMYKDAGCSTELEITGFGACESRDWFLSRQTGATIAVGFGLIKPLGISSAAPVLMIVSAEQYPGGCW